MCVSDKINAFCGEGDCKCARSRDGFTQLQMLVLALEELSSHETGVRRSGEIVIQRASAPLWRTAAVPRGSEVLRGLLIDRGKRCILLLACTGTTRLPLSRTGERQHQHANQGSGQRASERATARP